MPSVPGSHRMEAGTHNRAEEMVTLSASLSAKRAVDQLVESLTINQRVKFESLTDHQSRQGFGFRDPSSFYSGFRVIACVIFCGVSTVSRRATAERRCSGD